MTTNFQAVSAFNELIGNAKCAATVEQIEKQSDLIDSEFWELLNGIMHLKSASQMLADSKTDEQLAFARERIQLAVIEIRDGIANVLVTTYGLAHRIGIDADKDMQAVSTSNASKFFTGTEEQAATVCKALADSLGIHVIARQAESLDAGDGWPATQFVWAFVSADDSDPERPRGKLLKAPGYKPPVFD